MAPAFAVWITGLPASGKSTLAAVLARRLAERGIRVAILESDAWRKILTPSPTYTQAEREVFYGALAEIGALLVRHGVPVVFDATANRRLWRNRAREKIAAFAEVWVDCPLAVCMSRDPKGVYGRGASRPGGTVPGVQAPYEPPERPDLVVRGDAEGAESAAARVVAMLEARSFVEKGASP